MFRRHKKSIVRITKALRSLEEDQGNHGKLLQLQHDLVRLIKRGERRIRVLRTQISILRTQLKTGRPDKRNANLLRKKIKTIDETLDKYKKILYVWRCFGDGIAYLYIDKFAIKHVYYNTDNMEAKQSAGALSGKVGFRKEWSFVKYICDEKNIPCMLCDITNIIRHGDICLLGGPDPCPIEVKSSKNRNERGDRQIENLRKIHEFLQTDHSTSLRGSIGKTIRQEFKTAEVTYSQDLNRCIEEARINDYAQVTPEPGLHFICVKNAKALTEERFSIFRDCMALNLNELKADSSWAPYYPFTLMIRNPESLYEFIRGEFAILAGLHIPTLMEAFRARGITASYLDESENENYAIKMSWRFASLNEDVVMNVSRQFLARILVEQQSINWFAQAQLETYEELERGYPEFCVQGG